MGLGSDSFFACSVDQGCYATRPENSWGYFAPGVTTLGNELKRAGYHTPYSPLELYNLKDDPQEQSNLMGQAPKVFQELSTALRKHIQVGGATPWQPPKSP